MLFHVFFLIMLFGTIRIVILWFQTLIHGVKITQENNRVAVVLGQVLLGPLMALAYYLSSRLDTKVSSKPIRP